MDTLFPRDPGQPPAVTYNLIEDGHSMPITSTELAVTAKRMSAKNTAPGPDGILGKVISMALPVLEEEIVELFNKCLRESTVTSCWKVSKLVRLPKPGKDPNSPAAYRPICLLNEVGKLFERVVLNRIIRLPPREVYN